PSRGGAGPASRPQRRRRRGPLRAAEGRSPGSHPLRIALRTVAVPGAELWSRGATLQTTVRRALAAVLPRPSPAPHAEGRVAAGAPIAIAHSWRAFLTFC